MNKRVRRMTLATASCVGFWIAAHALPTIKDLPHLLLGGTKTTLPPVEFINIETPRGVLHVAKYETTVAEWEVCVQDGGCSAISVDQTTPDHPITGVNWHDIKAYLAWYSKRYGVNVRLPSREEWRIFAADHNPEKPRPLFNDPRMAWAASYDLNKSVDDSIRKPIGWFGVNRFGIADLKGSVWEWTATCGLEAPGLLADEAVCFYGRVAMGGHVAVLSDLLRDPGKGGCSVGQPPAHVGFRMVR